MDTERRLFLRKSINIPVRIVVADGGNAVTYEATINNLSKNGVQVSCTRELVVSLLEQEEYPPTCQLNFNLPDGQDAINVETRLVVNRRIAADQHNLGLNFVTFKGTGDAVLSNYLDRV